MYRMLPKLLFPVLILLTLPAAMAAPDGEALYGKHCSVCHGIDGGGGVGVPLAHPDFLRTVPDEYINKTIRYGRPGRIMPAFDNLSDAQLNAITSHVRSWGNGKTPEEDTSTIKGNVSNGKKLYASYCASCHGADGEGGKGTGVTFSRKRELPIIAPALNNSGFLASATDSMIRDTMKFGREGTPMTSQLVMGLSGDEIDDVVAYVRSFEKSMQEKKPAADEEIVIMVDSPYTMEETIENLKQSILDANFTLIRTEPLETGLVKEGEENIKQMVLHFCNFGFLFEALSIDPRVGMFLPCRITVIEDKGKVKLMAINPLRLSATFNNDELDKACKEMHDLYQELLEDATL